MVVAQQMLIGVALGFALQVMFDALGLGGQLLANSMGLSFAFNVDPLRGSSTPVLGQLYMMLVTLTFLALDGHLVLIEVLAHGFTTLPVGSTGFGREGLWMLVLWGGQLFAGAIAIALPGVTALLIVNLAFGVMSRAAPSLNLFAVGFPISLVVGLAGRAGRHRSACRRAWHELIAQGLAFVRALMRSVAPWPRTAQERTEQATPKRLEEARKKGQIPRSRELSTAAVCIAAAVAIYTLGAHGRGPVRRSHARLAERCGPRRAMAEDAMLAGADECRRARPVDRAAHSRRDVFRRAGRAARHRRLEFLRAGADAAVRAPESDRPASAACSRRAAWSSSCKGLAKVAVVGLIAWVLLQRAHAAAHGPVDRAAGAGHRSLRGADRLLADRAGAAAWPSSRPSTCRISSGSTPRSCA